MFCFWPFLVTFSSPSPNSAWSEVPLYSTMAYSSPWPLPGSSRTPELRTLWLRAAVASVCPQGLISVSDFRKTPATFGSVHHKEKPGTCSSAHSCPPQGLQRAHCPQPWLSPSRPERNQAFGMNLSETKILTKGPCPDSLPSAGRLQI